jgi:hypothetical protein
LQISCGSCRDSQIFLQVVRKGRLSIRYETL